MEWTRGVSLWGEGGERCDEYCVIDDYENRFSRIPIFVTK